MSRLWTAEDLSELENPDNTNQLSPLGNGVIDDDLGDVDESEAAKALEAAKPPEEFRYGNEAPEALRGKTASEVAALYQAQQVVAQTLVDHARRTNTAPPAAPAAPPEDYRLTEEDLLGTDPDKVNAKIQKMQDAKIQPLINDYHQKESVNVLEKARVNPEYKYFQKYENEILQLASQLPANQTSNPITWNLLYHNIIGRHTNEIVQAEIAAANAAPVETRTAPPPTERGNNRSAVGITAPKGQLSKEERQIARSLGVSEEEYLKYKQ